MLFQHKPNYIYANLISSERPNGRRLATNSQKFAPSGRTATSGLPQCSKQHGRSITSSARRELLDESTRHFMGRIKTKKSPAKAPG
jgi:hypothetical protein